MSPHINRRRRITGRCSRHAGSAYLIVLLVLFVLTLLGLSVALVTQVEILSAGSERTLEKVFFAAESGLQLSVANAISRGDFDQTTHSRPPLHTASKAVVQVQEQVDSSPFVCVADLPCDLCSINQGRQFSRRNHLVSVNARRFGLGAGGNEVVLARKSISSMVDVEPFAASLDCLADLDDATKGYRFDEY